MTARPLPYLTVAVGLILQLWMVFQPLSFWLSDLIPDDSFYYFQIARNIIEGNGVTFDGENPTNGFHPLWLVMLTGIFSIFSTGSEMDIEPVRAALALSVLLSALTAVTLLFILRRYTNSVWVQASALALWLFNPFVLYGMSSGLETPLSLALLSTTVLAAVRYSESPTMLRLLFVGAAAGLLMLARLDNVFYLLLFFVFLMYRHGFVVGIRHSIAAGLVATVFVAPWLAWNFVNFGMLFTSSSVSSTIVNHELVKVDNGEGLFVQMKAVVYMTERAVRQVIDQTGAPLLALMFIGAVIAWAISARERFVNLKMPVEAFLFAGTLLHFITSASIRWTFREWYFVAFNIFFVLFVAWMLGRWREGGWLRPLPSAVCALAVGALFVFAWEKDLRYAQSQQLVMYEAAHWMNENLPENSTIGVFNAGVQAYFSEHRIVNLDGLVNNEAASALRERRLWAYLDEEHIGYLADFDLYIQYRYRQFLGVESPWANLSEIHRVGGEKGIGIWRTLPSDE